MKNNSYIYTIMVNKEQSMDSEEPYKQSRNNDEQKQNSDSLFDGRNVFPTTRLRCGTNDSVKTNGFVSDYHFVFLPIITLVLWGVYVFI